MVPLANHSGYRLDPVQPMPHALHLAALHRQRDLAAAGIAHHQLEPGAQQIVQHHREVARRGAVAARADDQLGRQRVLEVLHRRVGAHEADIDVAVGVAEIKELRRLVLHRRAAEQRLQDRAGKDRAGHGAVLRRDGIDIPGRAVRSGAAHVLHHDRRIAGDVIAEMAREQPCVGVVAAARRRADHDLELLALVELLDEFSRRFLRHREARGCQHAGAGDDGTSQA